MTIKFDPSAAGNRTATLTIINNDSDEDNYTLPLTGTGTTEQRLTGTDNDDRITNPGGNLIIDAGAGDDDVEGSQDGESIRAGARSDRLI